MSQMQSADFQVFQSVTVTGATETLIGASVPCAVESPTVKCSVKVMLIFRPGTGTGAVQVFIRRGKDLTGVVINSGTTQAGGVVAGSTESFSAVASDALSNAGQAQYCFSVIQAGASGVGTVFEAAIETMVLSG